MMIPDSQLQEDGTTTSETAQPFTPDFDDSELLEGEVIPPGQKSEAEQKAADAEKKAHELETGKLKVAFYAGLCKISDQAGKQLGKRIPMGEPIAAISLAKRGAVGIAASDLTFDKLWKLKWSQPWLKKLEGIAKFMDEWGPIYTLLTEMAADTLEEIHMRKKAYEEQQQEGEQQQEQAA